jgi:plastocyanin
MPAVATAGEDRTEKDVRGLREAEIEADDHYFRPAVLRGDPGQKLRLTIENESGALHNVSIAALGVDRDVPPKGKIEIDVVFPREGATEFVCKIHAAMGMKGALVVGGAR